MATKVSINVALVRTENSSANRGIGLEIVRQLLKKFKGTVILTARSHERGTAAVKQLQSEGLAPEFLQLDVSDKNSIESARRTVADKYGRLDILVNNAGVIAKVKEAKFSDRAKHTIDINFFGTYNVTEAFRGLLQPDSRVVNISSSLGNITYLGDEWRDKLSSSDLTVDQLLAYMNQYIKDSASHDFTSKGWHTNILQLIIDETKLSPAEALKTLEVQCSPSYSVSKIGINRLTLLLAKQLESDTRTGILVNSVCPGWVRTDMGGPNAPKSVEEGTDTAVYLALLPPCTTEPQGKVLRDRKILEGYQ